MTETQTVTRRPTVIASPLIAQPGTGAITVTKAFKYAIDSEHLFECDSCGIKVGRDENAAINLAREVKHY